ncbi:hypothetical protein ACMGD3_24205 [Lysinibacillus sphaericus]|uniref:hypothetical protein n=1 Tax=Lysinibacillus sphaericus TaxID=1421 RepID=UPI003F7A8209
MKKIILILVLLFIPLYTQEAFANTDSSLMTVPDSNSSQTLGTVEETRKGFNGDFDDFINKARDLSIPVSITLLVIAGFLFLFGFIVSPLRKIAGTMFAGVILGFFFINYGEYLTGLLYGIYDFLISYF